MSDSNQNDREEILRLREENLRLREQQLASRPQPQPQPTTTISKTDAQVVNVKQVNESALGGCAGLIGVFFVIVMLLGKCSG